MAVPTIQEPYVHAEQYSWAGDRQVRGQRSDDTKSISQDFSSWPVFRAILQVFFFFISPRLFRTTSHNRTGHSAHSKT